MVKPSQECFQGEVCEDIEDLCSYTAVMYL